MKMPIRTVRRISQVFFFLLFLWFSVVATLGERWWQLRGWPVNWLIQLDPLVGLGTLLSTGTLYAGLLWSVLTIVATLVLGRFFCGWVCPFGTLHHFVGWLANRKRPAFKRIDLNRYRNGQTIKYMILLFLLGAATGNLANRILDLAVESLLIAAIIAAALLACGTAAAMATKRSWRRWICWTVVALMGWVTLGWVTDGSRLLAASLQTGLLDPIPLFYRSINLTLLPLIDGYTVSLSAPGRVYPGAFLIGAIFWTALFLNLRIPRFYCRFLCPLGALFGILGKNALWRMGQKPDGCTHCGTCDFHCEGGCQPSTVIHTAECVLCMNCQAECPHDAIGYHLYPSATGEITLPDLSKRAFVATLAAGLATPPLVRLSGTTGTNWNPGIIRPPGALPEKDFLERCIKCGQCMRICPTNVIHPAVFQAGIEGIWTPTLNFRMGTSGCQLGCIACGNLCPTAAIRPIDLDERQGKGVFADTGPIRIGTAFVDRGRCLPWAMDRPCIVCQENCPLSPKAIVTREHFQPVSLAGQIKLLEIDGNRLTINGPELSPHRYATGDAYLAVAGQPDGPKARITGVDSGSITVETNSWMETVDAGTTMSLMIRLQRPYVDPARCIGCGVCEHECPVKGRRAIRVTAENESRDRRHRMVL